METASQIPAGVSFHLPGPGTSPGAEDSAVARPPDLPARDGDEVDRPQVRSPSTQIKGREEKPGKREEASPEEKGMDVGKERQQWSEPCG